MDSGTDLPDAGAGFTTYDLLALPDDQRRLVRLVLQYGQLSYGGLCDAVDNLPPGDVLDRAGLDELLGVLLDLGWLTVAASAEEPVYRVQLRTVAERTNRPARAGLRDRVRRLWDALEDDSKG